MNFDIDTGRFPINVQTPKISLQVVAVRLSTVRPKGIEQRLTKGTVQHVFGAHVRQTRRRDSVTNAEAASKISA